MTDQFNEAREIALITLSARAAEIAQRPYSVERDSELRALGAEIARRAASA